MLSQHNFEPLNLNAIPKKGNGSILLLNVNGDWYGTSIWEHDDTDEDIYIEQDGEEYYVPKSKIKNAYLIRNK